MTNVLAGRHNIFNLTVMIRTVNDDVKVSKTLSGPQTKV